MNTEKSTINNQGQLIQEALTRRIRGAKNWQAVLEAWQALMAVQRMTQIEGTDIAGHEWGGDCADRTTIPDDNTVFITKDKFINLLNIKSLAVEARKRFKDLEPHIDDFTQQEHQDFMRRLDKHLSG